MFVLLFKFSFPAWKAASIDSEFYVASSALSTPRLSAGQWRTEGLGHQLQLQSWELDEGFLSKQNINLICLRKLRL